MKKINLMLTVLVMFAVGCLQSESSPPRLISEGEVTLLVEDHNTTNPGDTSVSFDIDDTYDLKATSTHGSGGLFYLLLPINGATGILIQDEKSPDLDVCLENKGAYGDGLISDYWTGDKVCLLTGPGYFVEILVLDVNASEQNGTQRSLRLAYKTWDLAGD